MRRKKPKQFIAKKLDVFKLCIYNVLYFISLLIIQNWLCISFPVNSFTVSEGYWFVSWSFIDLLHIWGEGTVGFGTDAKNILVLKMF